MVLDSIFSSGMVFPANKPLRIFGTGFGRAKITFAGYERVVESNEFFWEVTFPEMHYGGPHSLIFDEDGVITMLDDIYIGEVYLMSGQSNMQFKLKESDSTERKSNPMVRLFSTDRKEDTDFFHRRDGWVKCESESCGEWSAIAYHVGNMINEKKGVAVGLIACYQGASVIESWLDAESLERVGANLIPYTEKTFDHSPEHHSTWNGDSFLYGYALSQVIPFPLSAVVWYQGESDSAMGEAGIYLSELEALIRLWRKEFRDENLPFAVVQIADFDGWDDIPAWKKVQQAQEEISGILPNVATVVSKDVCQSDDIHPMSKSLLSTRVADALYGFIE